MRGLHLIHLTSPQPWVPILAPMDQLTEDIIRFQDAQTLPGLFRLRCARHPAGEAYRQYESRATGWRSFSWSDMAARVARWQGALAREGLQPGERVAVMLKNSVEWVCLDQAAQSLGLVVVPLYPTDNAENIAYILADCGAHVLLLSDSYRWAGLAPSKARFPQLARVLCATPSPGQPPGGMAMDLQAWLDLPPATPVLPQVEPDALATIVYTSGTTGRPKGVMLSHRNILANGDAVLQLVKGYREDVFLSFLPLSHMLERTVGYYVPMMTGSTVAFARSVQDLAEDLVTVRPTMLVSVPRIYERIYARLQQGLEDKGIAARSLFNWAEEMGWRRFEAAQHRAEPAGAAAGLMWPVLRHLVADKLLAHLGGRLRVAMTGGAPMSSRLMHCFIGLGLPLLQGYGLTEAAPIVTANTLEDNVPASVGVVLPGVELRAGQRGELLVRGPNVMLGYWNDPRKTSEAVDADGWLHTGDLGRIDSDGHVYITGRMKEIIVTSTGEKLSPADLELAITEDPLFEQVMVVGEARPYVAALAVLNGPAWREFAQELQVDPFRPGALEDDKVRKAILARLQVRLEAFPSYARVRAVWLTLEPWTADSGLITPTLKLRRQRVEQSFSAQVDALYAEHARPA